MEVECGALTTRTHQNGEEAFLDVAVVKHGGLASSKGEDYRGRIPLALGTFRVVPSARICDEKVTSSQSMFKPDIAYYGL